MMARKCFNPMKASLIIWILFVFYFMESLAEVCRKIDDCACLKNNGKVISLWEIDGGWRPAFKDIKTVLPPGVRYVFDWNPCTNFSEGLGCKDVLMCQKDSVTARTYPCADGVVDFKLESDGTTTIMYETLVDSTGYKRAVRINLKCDERLFPGEMSGVTEDYMPMYSAYSATLTSKCACDDGCISDDDVVF